MKTFLEELEAYEVERLAEIAKREVYFNSPEFQAKIATKKARELEIQISNRRHTVRNYPRVPVSNWSVA
jgi:hypothetical protein